MCQTRADPGFFEGGSWYLGVPELKGHAPRMWQFDNWNLIENYYTRNTSTTKKKIQ